MPGYLIHFSRRQSDNYSKAEQYLRSFGAFCRLTDNADTWIVFTDKIGEALTIRDKMLKNTPPNTQIFVLRIDFNETAWSAQPDISKWLENIYKPTEEQLKAQEAINKHVEEQLEIMRKDREAQLQTIRQDTERIDKIIAELEQKQSQSKKQ